MKIYNETVGLFKNKKLREKLLEARAIFENNFAIFFGNSGEVNREIIKRFADHPKVSSIFNSDELILTLRDNLDLGCPVKCGPTVTHYTSHNQTGLSYGPVPPRLSFNGLF